ncbi:MAG TPA: malto-oligosyltrehalose synthase [Terriglobia bacterium]|nr:malto-oligosyltrehalose synthase [Terriglobia bacterium]
MLTCRVPAATYRIQFSAQFRFQDARALVPYLHSLGITDLYASPLMQARRGSSHGYDVTDLSRINSEIGTEEEFEELVQELHRHQMGLILDIVPNHMAASSESPWWMDVLENGPSSAYATYFDIDWHPPHRTLENKVLLPLLGRPYAEVLENRELKLAYEESGFVLQYADLKLPVAPKSYLHILRHRLEELKQKAGSDSPSFRELEGILAAVTDLPERVSLPSEVAGERRMQREGIKERLWKLYQTSPEIHDFINENLKAFNGRKGDPESFSLLDELLADQAYILSFWRTANEEINYRRFFTITDLVGVRVEDPLVFDATHATVFRFIEKGLVTGLRIDHIDGLRDPLGYLRRLQERLGFSNSEGRSERFYTIVEKILSEGEALSGNWPVCGTTGYDFLNVLNGIFVSERGAGVLKGAYRDLLGMDLRFEDLVYEKKKEVMDSLLAVEMRSLGHHLGLVAEQDRYARDLPAAGLTQALIEVTACLRVYRTYTRDLTVAAADRGYILDALEAARRRNPNSNPAHFDFLGDVLLLREKVHLSPAQREARLAFVMRWQQFTGPIMAKGFEDTVLYIYNPLVSLNEVGGNPASSGISLAAFHEFLQKRLKEWPHSLNATTTHDTKRSEDVRARINILAEMPAEWEKRLNRWMAWNRAKKKLLTREREVPDRNEEILLYQTMLGAWPLQESEIPEFRKRLRDYMIKATREARIHTRWTRPNVAHEKALAEFIKAVTETSDDNLFFKDFIEFQRKIAFYGAFNALSQLILKIAAPGAPDFYQGSELWDLRLVDPDNRGRVDFDKRPRWLQELEGDEEENSPALIEKLLKQWEDGRIKLFAMRKALDFRRAHQQLFSEGDYLPGEAIGAKKECVIAFTRRNRNIHALVIVPRFVTRVVKGLKPPIGQKVWGRTAVVLPRKSPQNWRNILTQEMCSAAHHEGKRVLQVADALKSFPLALLAAHET